MLRTFQQHRVRQTESLDGIWRFTTDNGGGRRGLPPRYDRLMSVPSAWEMTPGLERYRGQAWAARTFTSAGGRAARLVFAGVSHTADVFVDGKKRGHHYDAFTPWDVVLPNLDAAEHELVVAIDNSFGQHSALHLGNDYMTYGGITRPAELQHLPEAWIERVHATPVAARRGWDLELRVRVSNWSARPVKRWLTVTVAGVVHELGNVTVAARDSKEVRRTLQALDVEPWSHEAPRLYELTAELYDGEEVVDDLIDRIGFRSVEVRGKKVLVNGESVRFRGYNRHEDHQNFGCAIPLEQMAQDLAILRDLGCNFVRTSHYPNDQRFLDLCDELGFYVWEESHARGVKFDHPKFREQIESSTREMVDWHHNHASIVMWGCLNECETRTPTGRAEYKRVIDMIRKADPSRPVTYASMYHEGDICFGLADIVSVNVYTGWYNNNLAGVEPRLKKFLKWLHSGESHGGRGKPVILSEFGAAGLYGFHDPRRCHYSEEYQSDVLDAELSAYLNHPDVAGVAIWQFSDIRVTERSWRDRPKTMNNKGTVDLSRRPKQCYATVKRRMLEARKRFGS